MVKEFYRLTFGCELGKLVFVYMRNHAAEVLEALVGGIYREGGKVFYKEVLCRCCDCTALCSAVPVTALYILLFYFYGCWR